MAFDEGDTLNLKSELVSIFRQTDLGKELEAEYIKQGILQTADDPILWLGIGLFVAVGIFILIK